MASVVQIGILFAADDPVTSVAPIPLDRWAVAPQVVSVTAGDGSVEFGDVVSPDSPHERGYVWYVHCEGDTGVAVRFDGSAADAQGHFVAAGGSREFRVTYAGVSPRVIPIASL